MKKVLSFVGAALFVAAMTVSCGNNNTEATDTIDSTAVEVVDEPAAAVEEVSAPVDNNGRASSPPVMPPTRTTNPSPTPSTRKP